jgi:glutamate-ammonia-ligase adenylyltransferase
VFAASPYLARLATRHPAELEALLAGDPARSLEAILAETAAAGALAPGAGAAALRRLKGRLHLLAALCDLGGVWDLGQVTGALTRFADASVGAALALTARSFEDRLAPAGCPVSSWSRSARWARSS